MRWLSILLLLGTMLVGGSVEAQPQTTIQKTANSLTTLCAEPLYNYNFEAAQALLDSTLKKNQAIYSLTITDALTGKQFISRTQPGEAPQTPQTLQQPILYHGTTIGQLTVHYSSHLWTLTPEEKAWIHQHPIVRFGLFHGEPVAIIKQGKLQGILGDYLAIIAERTGLRFQHVPTVSWPETLQQFRDKTIDLIPAVDLSDRPEMLGISTQTYLQFPYVVVSRIAESYIDSLDTLRGKSVAIPRHAHSDTLLQKHYPDIHIIHTRTIFEALDMVKEKKAFAFLGSLPVGMYYVGNYYANTLHISGKIDAGCHCSMLTQSTDPFLRSILDKAIDSISPKERRAIINRWLHIEVKEATDYTLFYRIGTALILLILASLYWNRKLTAEIAERKKIETKLARAKQEAELANQAKSIFLANMSHEIRTPMNAIVGFTELLHDAVQSPRLQAYVQSIQHANHTLLRLINDILDLSKIEAGKLEIEPTPTSIRHVCEEILSIFTLTAQKKGITLPLDLDPDLPEYLLIDEIRLRQILLNLVGNAVKFTEEGSVTLTAKTAPCPQGDGEVDVTFTVTDTGIGIPQDQVDEIFEAFQQMHGQDNRKYGGTGLGLSISKRLSEMMGGTLAVESTVGVGSTFQVKIPCSRVVTTGTAPRTDTAHSQHTFFPATILVVDDIESNRQLIVSMLEESAIHVLSARDGHEAVSLFHQIQIDLVLMDLQMPNMDGYAAAKAIRSDDPTVPIIAVSATSLKGDDAQRLFDGYLRKPITRAKLMAQLERFLPYDETSKTSTSDAGSTEWDFALLERCPSITPTHTQQILSSFHEAFGSNSIPQITAFLTTLRDTARACHTPAIHHYIDHLATALDSFDIAQIEHLLNRFNQSIPRGGDKEG